MFELAACRRIIASLNKCKADDRAYFARHPDRRHRVRVAGTAEVIERTVLTAASPALPPGLCWVALCKSFSPASRVRVIIPAPVGAPTDDLSDEEARVIWETVARVALRRGETLQ